MISQGNGYQGSGPGRARRDAAARAMQGWHVQRLSDYGEVGEPVIKVCENIILKPIFLRLNVALNSNSSFYDLIGQEHQYGEA